MNDFLDFAKARYSVRAYKPTPIPEAALARVLEAGQVAPTACNAQAVHTYVLQSDTALATVRSMTKFTFDAPAVLLVCYDSARTWHNKLEDGITSGQQDAAIVATHMMLEAWFDAPAVLLVCYDSARTWHNKLEDGITSGQQDAAIVATHMMLEAWDQGLGTCWVNLFPNSRLAAELSLAENHNNRTPPSSPPT